LSKPERVVRLLTRKVDPLEVFERVRRVVESLGCEAYLIGSWAGGRAIPASDIDILIVCKKLPKSMLERGRIKAWIFEKAGIPDYEDVHIELVEEKDKWYYLAP